MAIGTTAAYGGLKPPPTRRLRRAHLHLSYSMTLARLLDTGRSQFSGHFLSLDFGAFHAKLDFFNRHAQLQQLRACFLNDWRSRQRVVQF